MIGSAPDYRSKRTRTARLSPLASGLRRCAPTVSKAVDRHGRETFIGCDVRNREKFLHLSSITCRLAVRKVLAEAHRSNAADATIPYVAKHLQSVAVLGRGPRAGVNHTTVLHWLGAYEAGACPFAGLPSRYVPTAAGETMVGELVASVPPSTSRAARCRAITDPAQEAVMSWIGSRGLMSRDWLFPSCSRRGEHLTTR